MCRVRRACPRAGARARATRSRRRRRPRPPRAGRRPRHAVGRKASEWRRGGWRPAREQRPDRRTSSRWRFRLPHRVTFRIRVWPLGGASSYLRSVLDVRRRMPAAPLRLVGGCPDPACGLSANRNALGVPQSRRPLSVRKAPVRSDSGDNFPRGLPRVYAVVISGHRESPPVQSIRRAERPEVTPGDGGDTGPITRNEGVLGSSPSVGLKLGLALRDVAGLLSVLSLVTGWFTSPPGIRSPVRASR